MWVISVKHFSITNRLSAFLTVTKSKLIMALQINIDVLLLNKISLVPKVYFYVNTLNLGLDFFHKNSLINCYWIPN